MKKLLIGMLVFGAMSSFASEGGVCTIKGYEKADGIILDVCGNEWITLYNGSSEECVSEAIKFLGYQGVCNAVTINPFTREETLHSYPYYFTKVKYNFVEAGGIKISGKISK